MARYKSWSNLRKQLNGMLCEELRGRVDYFLTYYREVHNSYGRAAIRLDGRELCAFSWTDMYAQDRDVDALWRETGVWDSSAPELREKWDRGCVYCEKDFTGAATEYLNMSVDEALGSSDMIIRCLAVMDRRVGKRTLRKIRDSGEYLTLPDWVRQFYELRLNIKNDSAHS